MLYLHAESIEDKGEAFPYRRNMRAAQDPLGTWALYSWEPEESVGLLLVYSPILRILYQYLWAKVSMCL